MKLGYVSSAEVPSVAANSLHVVKMCQALAAGTDEVRLFALQGESTLGSVQDFYGFAPNFSLVTMAHSGIRGGGYRLAVKVLFRELRSQRCDRYYGRHIHTLFALASRGAAFAFEAHAMPENDYTEFLLRRLASHKRCKGIVCISDQLAEDMLQVLPKHTRVLVLRDAADPAPAGVQPVYEWSGRKGVPQIGYVGHLYPGKGMEVVRALAQTMPHLDFHVIGGRDSDIQFWRGQGALPNLYYHGFVPHAQLPGYYVRLDVALLPLQDQVWNADGKHEIGRWTSPLKAFEYMAHGLPIVASHTNALKEIFVANETALLVDPRDLACWQQAITTLVNNRVLALEIGRQAQEVFLNEFTWAQRARSVVELLA